MSVDYFLFSPSYKKCVCVGSVGLSGVMPWPGTPEVVKFIQWVIEENIKDVCLINEDELDVQLALEDIYDA